MNTLHTVVAISSAIILFIFGIENFSKEIQRVTGDKFRKFLAKGTKNPILGCLLGAGVTSIIQSSTATSVIAVGLVNAGALSFKGSLAIIFGANIGTTVTAQLVALKLTNFAPIFIVIGFFLSIVRIKYSFIGKSIFFFGFVFFSLNLLSAATAPIQADPAFQKLLSQVENPWLGVLIGTLFTAVVQSSSVTTGISVIMLQNGLLTFDGAIPIILGANIGTTITAVIASTKMDTSAKRTAMSHVIYNVAGVVVFLPIVLQIPFPTLKSSTQAASLLANVHLVFNFSTSILFLLLIKPYSKLLERIIPSDKDDLLEAIHFPSPDDVETPEKRLAFLDSFIEKSLVLLKVNYRLVTLSLESKEEILLKKCVKNQAYLDYIKSEVNDFLTHSSDQGLDEKNSKHLVNNVNRIDYIYQIGDSITELVTLTEDSFTTKTSLSVDMLMSLREISDKALNLFDVFCSTSTLDNKKNELINDAIDTYGKSVDKTYKTILKMMASREDKNAAILTRFLSLNHRIKDKLLSLERLSDDPDTIPST